MNPCNFSVPECALKAFQMLDSVIENHCFQLNFRFYKKPFKAGFHSHLLFSTLLVQNCCLPGEEGLPWYRALRSRYSD